MSCKASTHPFLSISRRKETLQRLHSSPFFGVGAQRQAFLFSADLWGREEDLLWLSSIPKMETSLVCCRCVEAKAVGVETLRASPDGRWVAVARSNGTLEIYESSTDFLKLRLSDESCSSIRSILWVPASCRAASIFEATAGDLCGTSSSQSSTQKRRRFAHGMGKDQGLSSKRKTHEDEEETESEEHERTEGKITDGRYCGGSLLEWRLVTAGLHGVISEWNLRTLSIQSETPSYGGAVFSLASAPYGVPSSRFAAACDDGRVRLFEVQGRPCKAASEASKGKKKKHSKFLEDGEKTDELEAGESDDGEGGIVLVASLPKTSARLLSVCWYSPDLIFAGNAASTILRFSSSSSSTTWKVADPGSTSGTVGGGFIADGKMVLLETPRDQGQNRSKGGTTDTKQTGKAHICSSGAVLVWSLFALPAADLLLSGDSKGCVTVWSLPTCVALRRLPLHAADVLNVEGRITGRLADRGRVDRDQLNYGKKDGRTITIVSAGIDGKLGVAVRHKDGDWVVGPTRYPHSCDIRALALISATPDVSGGSGSRGPRHTSHNFAFLGEGASLIAVTGAVDGSICFNERLMGLASVGTHPRPLPAHPLATGLRPRIALAQSSKENLVLACSDDGLDLWNMDASLSLKNNVSSSNTAGVIKLLHIDLRNGSHARCGDLTPDGTLIAAGSRRGLHLFGIHLKELEVVDVEGGRACAEVRDVTAVRFLTNDTLACCCACTSSSFSSTRRPSGAQESSPRSRRDKKTWSDSAISKRSQANTYNERGTVDSSESDSTATSSSSEDEELSSRHTEGKQSSGATDVSTVSVEASLEAEWRSVFGTGIQKRDLSRGYRLLILDIWKGGKVLGEIGPFPYPVRSFDLSLDGQLLACLFTSGSLLVVSLSNYTPLHFFSSFPLLGSEICCSCFSPPSSGSTSSHICLFSPTRHYSIIPLMEEGEAKIEEHDEKKEKAVRKSRGDGVTRQDSRSDDGDSEASSDEGERENKRRKRNTTQTTEVSPDSVLSRRKRGRRNNTISSQYTRPRVRQIPRSCAGPADGSVIGALWIDASTFHTAAGESYSSFLPTRSPSFSSAVSDSPKETLDNSVLLCLTPSVLCRLPLSLSRCPRNRNKDFRRCGEKKPQEALTPSGLGANVEEENSPKEGDVNGQSSDDGLGRPSCYGTSGSDGEDGDGNTDAICLQGADGFLDCSRRAGQASPGNMSACVRSLSPMCRSLPSWKRSTICPPPLYARSRLLHQNLLRFLPPFLQQLQYLRSRRELLQMLSHGNPRSLCGHMYISKAPCLLDEKTEKSHHQGAGGLAASPRTSLSTTCSSPTSWGNIKKEGYSQSVQTDQDTQSEENEKAVLERLQRDEESSSESSDRFQKERGEDLRLSTLHPKSLSRCIVIKQSKKRGFVALGFLRSQATKTWARAEDRGESRNKGRKATRSAKTDSFLQAAPNRVGSLVLVEALGGAILEPEMMPTPFNRKKYGT
ncbi:12x wd40 repeat containing protein [Cystoisospora suis]|uniref:12x wd40 repeat containing protein n=1 Tax=Cystoisospora suis TaxID=483139 RepID=A0A2C6L1B9_9APIC|nr:12x wd40 repeat containing protein [Cystoisospora suis]